MNTLSSFIAVVDDEEPNRRALLRLMRSAGIAARAYASGAEFIAALALCRPGCVILDLHMPDMSGFEVQAWLAEHLPRLPVIIVTGHHGDEVRALAMRNAPLAYLLKPMHDQLLLDAIALAARQPAAPADQPATLP